MRRKNEDAKPTERKADGKGKYSMVKSIVEWVIYFAVLIGVYVAFRYYLMLARIPSESMSPTIEVHDWTIGVRNAYKDTAPQRGDIINFYNEEEDLMMVKRVIGLPGEKVSFINDHVYIDDVWLDESDYLASDVLTASDMTFTVPEDSVFVLGDNRSVSLDSRFWKYPYVSYDDIKCKVECIIPFHKLPWF